jgi:hypothetical protein
MKIKDLPSFLACGFFSLPSGVIVCTPIKYHTFLVCHVDLVRDDEVFCTVIDFRTGELPSDGADATELMTDQTTARAAAKSFGPRFCVTFYLELADGSHIMLLPDELWCDRCLLPVTRGRQIWKP